MIFSNIVLLGDLYSNLLQDGIGEISRLRRKQDGKNVRTV